MAETRALSWQFAPLNADGRFGQKLPYARHPADGLKWVDSGHA
jgi:hypothetical protein